jgi:two-component system, OmpR family, response regulator BaeR
MPGVAEIRIDEDTSSVWVDDRLVSPALSPGVFRLLQILRAHPGRIFAKDDLLDILWPSHRTPSEDAVDGLAKRLRAQLRETDPSHNYIEFVRGKGIRLNL